MVVLIIIVNVVFLVAIGAIWESWHAVRGSIDAPVGDGRTLRCRSWPADAELVGAMMDRAGVAAAARHHPVRADRHVLCEAAPEAVGVARDRLVQVAQDEGFRVLRSRNEAVVLWRGSRVLQIGIGRG